MIRKKETVVERERVKEAGKERERRREREEPFK